MIHADAESVRSVASALESFDENLEALKSTLRSAVSNAREGWPDERGQATESSIEEMLNGINVSEETSRIANECNTLADKLDEL